jgi:hypothetical protein
VLPFDSRNARDAIGLRQVAKIDVVVELTLARHRPRKLMPSSVADVSNVVCCFCGNTVAHHHLQLRHAPNRTLTCSDAFMDPDDLRSGKGRDPDASFGYRNAASGRRSGRQKQCG